MAGHSQFANIMHRKGLQDKIRGKVFQKLVREVHVAIKKQGPNPDSNPRLRLLMDKAKTVNMPKDILLRAINKASSHTDHTNYEEIVYEGYGPGSIAIIIHCLTDNKNRTASNIRSYFNKCNGKLAVANSVQYLFNTIGVIEFTTNLDLEQIVNLILDYDILNWEKTDKIVHLAVNPQQLAVVSKTLESNKINSFITNSIKNLPIQFITVNNSSDLQLTQKLFELLEDDEDVLYFEHNLKIN